MIVIVDYGMGNLRSVAKAFEKVGFSPYVTADPKDIAQASGIVLPGVGAFGDAMANLQSLGLKDKILEAISQGKPYLGICLGLQLLFEKSEESPSFPGFDIIKGEVLRLPPSVKIPHIGWNQIKKSKDISLLSEIRDGSFFYFDHSYYVKPRAPEVIATTTDYGLEFTSAILKDNIFAVQFHPEKSGKIGLEILKNFGEFAL